jgi:hypothetical protein
MGGQRPEGNQTKQGTPEPTARANEAHEPEPNPAKHFEGLEEGTNPTGQTEAGKETRTEEGEPIK